MIVPLTLTSVTAPTVEPISIDEAANFCRVTDTNDFADLESMIAVAREKVELRTGLALISQQFQLTAQAWRDLWEPQDRWRRYYSQVSGLLSLYPSYQHAEPNVIFLDRSPLLSLDSVQYYDTADRPANMNTRPKMTPTPGALNPSPVPGAFTINSTSVWPDLYDRPDAVQIKFTAGFGTIPGHVPQTLRHAMKLIVKHFFDNRDAFTIGSGSAIELPHGLTDLLDSRRSGGWVS